MPEGDASHATSSQRPPRPRGRLLRRTTTGLVVLVLAVAVAAYPLDLGERLGIAVDPDEPASVAPPDGLTLPAARVAPAVAPAATSTAVDRAAVARVLRPLVRAPVLGRRVTVMVAPLGSSRPVYATGARVVTPASTLKLLTAAAALEVLGPDHRFATTVVRSGRQLVLVGGGDPLLTRVPDPDDAYPRRADLTTLARRAATALDQAGVRRIRLGFDTSLFAGPEVEPTWEPDYVPQNVVSPITPLWVDEGRERAGYSSRSADPDLAAAEFFSAALRKRGIAVEGRPRPVQAPASATPLAEVEGAPLSQVVQHVLELSDNEGAEVLARHVAIAQGGEASFDGGVEAVEDVLAALGVRLTGADLHDGSGLSRKDRLAPATLIDVLRVAATDPDLRSVLTGLPVAGFSGSLTYRFEMAPRAALGEVRAKTGTLTGVHGLAGTVRTRDGAVLAFVAIADRVRPFESLTARARLDQVVGALAACVCG
ncbi:MAG TPA: D-alanyl-D-alanine carboxypeptidase/D-alanyl-D-alanine-endopeptidase [Nocardioidaceae bacterium]|nr:D-alanyl-D-alanine carboxypeptidase/D-alanyl-D-alanine-endopeptidase [Nocardioidaceae bacterium]